MARDTARLESPSKAIKLKANEKVVDIILAYRAINKNAVKAILLKAWSSTAKGVQIVTIFFCLVKEF